ncbi:MAG: TetR/AcrR family transcriptional regulator [Gracilibacteraceae bacterium]|jgi:AcrR family transcriptional regulator|nr:TetR/AcrR family transcriptional regulator [Gracilibacteraceae bacterium]
MTRKNNPQQTISKILDVSAELFMEKGYEHTTMQDIVNGLGMSKGAIFHHFKSKEDVMNGVIQRMTELIANRATAIADDPALSVAEKMQRAILSMNISEGIGGKVITELHKPGNAQMHHTSIMNIMRMVTPILARIVEEGIREGIYNTPFPLETTEILIAASQVVFDSGISRWNREELTARALAFVRMMELSLGAAEGSFGFMLDNI